MKRKSQVALAVAAAAVFGGSKALATSVFSDDFNRTTVNGTYTYTTTASTSNNGTTAGSDGGAITDGSHGGVANALSLTNDSTTAGNTNGLVYTTTPMTGFDPSWNVVLDSNSNDVITWTLNWTSNRNSASSLAPMSAGTYGAGFVLAGTNANIAGAGSGYAIVIGSSGTPDPVLLIKYNNGIATTANRTTLITGAQDTRNPSTNNIDAFSIKVTLDTTTDTWSLSTRDDGTAPSAWADPTNNAGYVSAGAPFVDNTYTGNAMAVIGGIWTYATTANTTTSFDNLKVDVSPSTGGGSTARSLVWVGTTATWGDANNWSDAGNPATWDSTRPDNATFDATGTNKAVTLVSPQSAGSLTINSPGYSLNGTQPLTLYGGASLAGVTLNANATFNAPLIIAKPQIWTIASGTTLTNNSVWSGSGQININNTGGTLTLNTPSPSYSGPVTINGGTVAVNASDSNYFTGLGSGGLTLNNAILQLADGVTMGKDTSTSTSGAKSIAINNGSAIVAKGNVWLEAASSNPTIGGTANTTVTLATTNATDVFEINSAIRGGSTTATVNVSGPGKIILGSGAVSSSPFIGNWVVQQGILQLGPVGTFFGEPLNALGWNSNTSTGTGFGNPVTVNAGAILVGAMDSANPNNSPVLGVDTFRPTVTLNGSLATSVVGYSQWGGHFIFNDGSKILTYDPSSPSSTKEVQIVGNGNTTWNGNLTLDPGTSGGGSVRFNRNGSTVTVNPGSKLTVNPGVTVNLFGDNVMGDGTNQVSLANNGTFNVHSNQTIGNITGTGSLNIVDGASATAKSISQQSISLSSSILALTPGSAVSSTNSLSVDSGSKLDLSNNALIVNYTGSSPASAIHDAIVSARDNGAWDGNGITSSTAAGDTNFRTTIGYAEASALGLANGGSYHGKTISGQAVIVKYTYAGDNDLDGKVTLNDFAIFVDGFNGLGTGWVYGDYDYSGTVDPTDFAAFVDSYKNQGSSLSDLRSAILSDADLSTAQKNAMLSVVPEPGTLALATVAATGFLAGRRRRGVQEK